MKIKVSTVTGVTQKTVVRIMPDDTLVRVKTASDMNAYIPRFDKGDESGMVAYGALPFKTAEARSMRIELSVRGKGRRSVVGCAKLINPDHEKKDPNEVPEPRIEA